MTWQVQALGQVLDDVRSGFASGEDVADGVFQFRMNNVTVDGSLDLSKRRRVPHPTRGLNGLLLQPGDVLFNATNSPELVGKVAYFSGFDEPATFSNHFLRLRPGNVIEGRYLARWLTFQFQRGAFRSITRRWVNQAAIDKEGLLRLPIAVPPQPEQRRIADILDVADALRAKRRHIIPELPTLTQSIFLDMFGDPTGNPNRWPRNALATLIAGGPQNGLYKPASDYGSGTRILRIDGFYDGVVTKVDSLKRVRLTSTEQELYGLRPGDVVINRVNSKEFVGKSALVPSLPEDTVFESNMMRFQVDTRMVEPEYLVAFLQTDFIRRQIQRATKDAVNQSSINQTDVRAFEVNVPPLAVQREFIRRTGKVHALERCARTAEREAGVLFASLQHLAFRGEL
jgi:type I restriction enzyme S subunit